MRQESIRVEEEEEMDESTPSSLMMKQEYNKSTMNSSRSIPNVFLYILLIIFILLALVGLGLAFVDFSFPDRTNSSNRLIDTTHQIIIDLPVESFMITASVGCLCIVVMIFVWIIGLKRNNHQQQGNDQQQMNDKLEIDAMVSTFTRQFIKKEIKYLIVFVIIVGCLLIGFDQTNLFVTNSICFILGCFSTMLIIYVNSLLSNSNSTISIGIDETIGISIRFGCVIGYFSIGISLIMLIACFLIFSNMNAVVSFVFGSSSVALIFKLSGSVFQNSAGITMNLLEQYINSSTTGQGDDLISDHKRNPIIVAKIVGEHIGGIVAHNSDVIQSFVAIIVLSSIIGSQYFGTNGISLPLYLLIINILTSFIGITVSSLSGHPSLKNNTSQESEKKISRTIIKSIVVSGVINIILTLSVTFTLFDIVTQGWAIFACYLVGFLNGVLIQFLFRYYTFHRFQQVQHLALNSTSWYHYVSSGFSHTVLSLIIPILTIIVNIITSSVLSTFMTGGRANGSLFGLTISAIGMSSNMIFFLALDTIAPNFNIRFLDQKKESKLNSIIHTYFISNGTANRSYLLSTTFLFCLSAIQFVMVKSGLSVVNVVDISTLIGLITGLVVPFIIVGLLWRSINYCSMLMINEFKGQLREIDGLLEGRPNSRPNYMNINQLQSAKSIRGIVMITSLIFLLPILVGLIGRQKMLLGFVTSFSLVGYILSYLILNLGFSWNSVKRLVEGSNQESPQLINTDATRYNAIVADSIGIPLRDSLAPSLLSSIRVVILICLITAPTLKYLYP